MLFLVALVMALSVGLPQFTERGIQGSVDAAVQMTERFTRNPVTPEMYADIESRTRRFGPYQTIIGTFVSLPLFTLLFTALYWFLFNAILGGAATFKQVLGVVSHSQVITALGVAVAAPIMYAQNSFTQTGPFTLAAFANAASAGGFLTNFLGGIGVFPIWGLLVTAIGLGVLYRRGTTGIAIFLIAIYLVIVAGFAAIFS